MALITMPLELLLLFVTRGISISSSCDLSNCFMNEKSQVSHALTYKTAAVKSYASHRHSQAEMKHCISVQATLNVKHWLFSNDIIHRKEKNPGQ